ncbi:hypothetical protein R50076_00090 [Gilvimarinus japonicus]
MANKSMRKKVYKEISSCLLESTDSKPTLAHQSVGLVYLKAKFSLHYRSHSGKGEQGLKQA